MIAPFTPSSIFVYSLRNRSSSNEQRAHHERDSGKQFN
jgi:hypothetical protein